MLAGVCIPKLQPRRHEGGLDIPCMPIQLELILSIYACDGKSCCRDLCSHAGYQYQRV